VTGERALLPDRGVVRASGADARRLLQDLVTAEVAGLAPGEARWSALLTPQGKILFDFLVVCEDRDSFLFDILRGKAADFAKRLLFYRLRADMAVTDLSAEFAVAAGWGEAAEGAPGLAFRDPRPDDLGFRVIGAPAELSAWAQDRSGGSAEAYHAHRVALGIPEGGADFPLGDTFPHEACMDQLGAVDFAKGCYVGQEVVSRMQHRGTARSRVVPVRLEGAASPGTEVTAGGKPAGRLGSLAGDRGLALLRLDRVADAPAEILAGAARLSLVKPPWARFPFPGESGFGQSRAHEP